MAFPGGPVPAMNPEGLSFADDLDWESEVTKPMGTDVTESFARDSAAPETFPASVRIAASGAIVEATDDELGDAVAYVSRLAGLVGELLGLEGLRAMECASKQERLVALVGDDGETRAARLPASTDLAAFRERGGL